MSRIIKWGSGNSNTYSRIPTPTFVSLLSFFLSFTFSHFLCHHPMTVIMEGRSSGMWEKQRWSSSAFIIKLHKATLVGCEYLLFPFTYPASFPSRDERCCYFWRPSDFKPTVSDKYEFNILFIWSFSHAIELMTLFNYFYFGLNDIGEYILM